MAKRNHLKVVEARWEAKEETGRVVQEKFKRLRDVAPISAKTDAQKAYLKSLKENIISVATGHAGCGKTFCASYYAGQLLNSGDIDKIFITRPYAHLGTDYGATPGDDWMKLEPFCRPSLDTLKKVLGEPNYNYCVEKGIIEISPLEKIQGRSFDEKCAIIADEMQNASKPQAISLVTRLGEDVNFLAICGDGRQSITKGENTLDWLVGFFERNKISKVGITHFSEKDCVRSGLVKEILIAFEREGGFYSRI